MCIPTSLYQNGQVYKMLKYRNQSAKTEVRTPKYRSEKKSSLLVFSTLVIHNCVCGDLVAKG